MPESINSTVESATVKTQKMVDDFKKTETGKKVSRSTSAALGSVYSFVDSLLGKGEELVDRYLPEPQPSTSEQAAPSSSSPVSPFNRALSLGSTVCSRLRARATTKAYDFGSNIRMSFKKVYANVMDYFDAYLKSFQTTISYVKDTFPALQIAEDDFLAIRNKANEWWVAFVERIQKVFSDNKEAAQTSVKRGQDTVQQYTTQAKETAAKYSAHAKDVANKYSADVKDRATKAKETAGVYAADAKETANRYAAGAREAAGKYAADAKETADKYYHTAADKMSASTSK